MSSFFLFPGLILVWFLYGNANFASFTIHDSDDCVLQHEVRRTKRKRLFFKYVIYLFARKGIYITLIG